jgi:tRNA modification GTPase
MRKSHHSGVQIVHATANRPGAIAIIQLLGHSASLLCDLTGVADWPIARMRLVNFSDIDEGIAVRLTENVAQLMPHGGPRVLQRLTARLIELGAEMCLDPLLKSADPQELYPEAQDRVEALMLHTLARAQSPLAIDVLLDQPRRWRDALRVAHSPTREDEARSRRLNRLIDPPMVVLAGAPNVGKSTLSNALLGRSMSIELDMHGTTRDYTAARIELAGLVVDWHDTPGIRSTRDPIEQRAIELARELIAKADLLVAMSDHEHSWPQLTRKADLHIVNKIDLSGRADGDGLQISARTGEGIADLVKAIRCALVPEQDLADPGLWIFDERLRTASS